MQSAVTIVMYHFVRDLNRSRYPNLKGLDLADFQGQLAHIRKNYYPIRMEELIEAATNPAADLPPKAVLLTFDDGYIDHFTNVFPILDKDGIQGAFFPPAKAIDEKQILDVNMIHFVLATVKEKARLIDYIFKEIDANRQGFQLESSEVYYKKYAIQNRFDTADVVFIKRILQKELPEALRSTIIAKLFKRFVTEDESAFAAELYMSTEQLACMRRHGMYIGSHGYDHYWLDGLSRQEQEREIDRSLEFLSSLGCSQTNWVMCYPYGGCNHSLKDVLRQRGCCIGLGTKVGIADLSIDDTLILPRLDTNDLPVSPSAHPNQWTNQVLGQHFKQR